MKEIPDANLKLPEKTIIMLKNLNHRIIPKGFDNIKVLNSIAIVELVEYTKNMSQEEFYAFIIANVEKLQRKGIVKDNARSIGKKKKW